MELIFNYAPFDLPLDSLEVTIVDSGELTVDGAAISIYIYVASQPCDHATTSDNVSVYMCTYETSPPGLRCGTTEVYKCTFSNNVHLASFLC